MPKPLILSAGLMLLACLSAGAARADWGATTPDYQELGYYAFSCIPAEGDDESGDAEACLGLGCHDGALTLTGLGQWLPGAPVTIRLDAGGRVASVNLTDDQEATESSGWLLMKGGISRDLLESLRSAETVSVRTDGVEPLTFSMKGYSQELEKVTRICR